MRIFSSVFSQSVNTVASAPPDAVPATSAATTVVAMAAPAPSSEVSLSEPLSRFIFDRGHVKVGGSQAKWRAFYLKPTDNDVSIARIGDMEEGAIWTLGDETGAERQRRAIARADFTRTTVQATRSDVAPRIDVVPYPPPPSHALIVNWPAQDEARRSICMVLAAEGTAVARSA